MSTKEQKLAALQKALMNSGTLDELEILRREAEIELNRAFIRAKRRDKRLADIQAQAEELVQIAERRHKELGGAKWRKA